MTPVPTRSFSAMSDAIKKLVVRGWQFNYRVEYADDIDGVEIIAPRRAANEAWSFSARGATLTCTPSTLGTSAANQRPAGRMTIRLPKSRQGSVNVEVRAS